MENTEKKPNKVLKTIITIVVIAALGVLIYYSIQDRKKAAYTVALIDMPQNFTQQLKKSFESQFVGKVDYIDLPSDFEPTSKSLKNFDLVIMWNGKRTEAFTNYAKQFQPFLYDDMSPSLSKQFLNNDKPYIMPLLYDPYLLHTLKETDEIYYLSIPEDKEEMEICLTGAANFNLIPLSVAGGNDKTLLAYIGLLVLQEGGVDAYNKLCTEISKTPDLTSVADTVLTVTQNNEELTLRKIISSVKENKGVLLNKKFATLSDSEEIALMENKEVYGDVRQLSGFNALSDKTRSKYNTTIFPPDYSFENQSLLSSQIVMMCFSSKKITDTVARYLTLPQVQSFLAASTGLVPVNEKASCSTTIAAGIQEYAYYCTGGLSVDLYNACFNTEKEAASFCSQLRSWL